MNAHPIQEYYMYELVDNAIINTEYSAYHPNLHPESHEALIEMLQDKSYEFYNTPYGRIFWDYGEGDGIFWGTDEEYQQLDAWIQSEIQILIQKDM